MILRNAAARHGRRALAAPVLRPGLRQLSTESETGNSSAEAAGSSGAGRPAQAWPLSQPSAAPAVILSSKRKKQKILESMTTTLAADTVHERRGAWVKPHQVGSEVMTPAQQYAAFQRIQKNTRSLGACVVKRYMPSQLIGDPPKPEDVTLELLMASQTHMGHHTSLWNPANSRYIYGVRQGIHIISLETTAAHLRRAARVVEEVSYRGGLILFAGTRKGQMEIVTRAAELAGACHLFTKWTPGAITNRDLILRADDTKVVDQLDKELDGFYLYRNTTRPLRPDLVVCLNPLENYTLLYECGLENIPTIGVIDTNADPSWVTYTIPANDDSLRAMSVVGGVLGRAGERGRKRRLEDAAQGNVPWRTSRELSQHMAREVRAAIRKRKEVMGRVQTNVEGFTEEEKKLLTQYYLGEEAEVSEDEMMVSEDEMLNMMGETASEGTTEATVGEAEAAMAKDGQEAALEEAETVMEESQQAMTEEPEAALEESQEGQEEAVSEEAQEAMAEKPEQTTSEELPETLTEEPQEAAAGEPQEAASEGPQQAVAEEAEQAASEGAQEASSEEEQVAVTQEVQEAAAEESQKAASAESQGAVTAEPEPAGSEEPEPVASEEPEQEATTEEPREAAPEETEEPGKAPSEGPDEATPASEGRRQATTEGAAGDGESDKPGRE